MILTQAQVAKCAADGMTLQETADELGVSYDTVRNRAMRANQVGAKVTFTREVDRNYRDFVKDMKPIEAVDYLLGAIEILQGVVGQDQIDHGFHLTPLEERLFSALASRPGKTLSKSAIYDAIYFDRASADDLPDPKIIDILICKIRQKLPKDKGQIETAWGRGYRFVPAAQEAQTS